MKRTRTFEESTVKLTAHLRRINKVTRNRKSIASALDTHNKHPVPNKQKPATVAIKTSKNQPEDNEKKAQETPPIHF
jgi:hypothetical protein